MGGGGYTMYWLRLYEFITIKRGHIHAGNYFLQGYGRNFVGPGFLNAVNNYFGFTVWK